MERIRRTGRAYSRCPRIRGQPGSGLDDDAICKGPRQRLKGLVGFARGQARSGASPEIGLRHLPELGREPQTEGYREDLEIADVEFS